MPLDIPEEDLQRCHDVLGISSWQVLKGQSIFMAGGTGYIGKWLLATLIDANEKLNLDCRITVLSRDPCVFQRAWPAVAGTLNWIAGDVRDFPITNEHFDVIIHAATDVASQISPHDLFSICLDGTRHLLELASKCSASRFLLVSSGAVYGPLPTGMTHVPETHLGGPDPLLASSAYGEGKRVSEWLCAQATSNGLEVKIARVFALVGPHLPLDKQFAIGNFLQSAMAGEQIIIQGDGTPYRSYLYAADMAAWLWAVLIRGHSGRAYNVGSEESLSIRSLAERIYSLLGCKQGIVTLQNATSGSAAAHFVPAFGRIRHDLNLPPPISLDEAIARTLRWHFRY
ncbi:MAG: NAD(P)-dependent oxidoreductase [Cyanobacteria bacterium]|nr:NAD(P)-dependent oxidoreductase [Cyanobacteriota bacterium]